jgi:hypothetical protein
VAVPWALVTRELVDAKPVVTRGHATAVVWADRVFTSKGKLARWLRSRGATYGRWAATHPSSPLSDAVTPSRKVRLRAAAAPARAESGQRPSSIRTSSSAARILELLLLALGTLAVGVALAPARLLRAAVPRARPLAPELRFYVVGGGVALLVGVAVAASFA